MSTFRCLPALSSPLFLIKWKELKVCLNYTVGFELNFVPCRRNLIYLMASNLSANSRKTQGLLTVLGFNQNHTVFGPPRVDFLEFSLSVNRNDLSSVKEEQEKGLYWNMFPFSGRKIVGSSISFDA